MNNRLLTKPACMIAMMIVTCLLLAACGQSTAPTASSSTATTNTDTSTNAGTDTATERTIDTAKGKITIPAHPERIVSTYYHGTLIALGLKPVAATKEWWMGSPFLKEQEQGIEDVGTPTSIEKVMSLNPDLIVINDFDVKSYDQFSQIAPTLYVPYTAYNNPKEEIQMFGKLLGREQQAQAWLAQYDEAARAAREKIKDVVKPGETAVLINVREKNISILGDNYGRGGYALYDALQFKPLDNVKKEVIDSRKQILPIQMENLPDYLNADRIFICFNDGTTEAQKKAVLNSAVWNSLPAVKNGQVYDLPYDTFSYYDPTSIVGQIGVLADMIVDKNK
ncbi:ABC transporter substrate-binding protein [Paenibacillus shenyangensis]|uniref:ABC transporter substrate-binding protein n=1 Tax=Paenibacillus sp. A9 TaxID=1284352 RepID=UPI0003646350|nr:ABC transporter substrate-binding protein [Paenibacillus sp. A9]